MRLFTKKQKMYYNSEAEMMRNAEFLIARGYHVEQDVQVQPIANVCVSVYKLVYWK